MPIKDLSNVRRIPRIGKIRLGIKVEVPGKNPYPKATDYFNVPDEIKNIVGEEPKKLNIMFPTENKDEFAQQWLRCYSFSQGLICKGDGVKAVRKIDVANGDIASHTTEEWTRKDWGCDPDTCVQFSEKQCRPVMNLLFLMPDVPGLGVWQLDTSSYYSIVNINSSLAPDGLIRKLCGRVSFIPLVLSLEPQIVEPEGIKKKTVHVLNVRSEVKLVEIQKLGRVPPEKVLLPAFDENEIPEDLIPEEIAGKAEAEVAEKRAPERPAPIEPIVEKPATDITEADIPDMDAVVKLCFHFWQMKPVEICGELGYGTMIDLHASGLSPWDTWLTIKQLRQPPEPEEAPVPEPEPVPEPAAQEEPPQEVEQLWPEDTPPGGAEEHDTQLEPESKPVEEIKGFVDIARLEENLKTLRAKNLTAWEEKNLLSYIKMTYTVEGETVLEAAAKMDQGAATHFMKRIQEALPMI